MTDSQQTTIDSLRLAICPEGRFVPKRHKFSAASRLTEKARAGRQRAVKSLAAASTAAVSISAVVLSSPIAA